MARLSAGELARKLVHIGVGTIAFTLRWLGPLWGAVAALVAVAMNLFVLDKIGGQRLWRESDRARGRALGIVLYPVAVLLLILFFWQRLEVAAAIWGILAFGDGTASIFGMAFGRAKLPWNPGKSWIGTFAYFLFGTAAAAALLMWTAPVSGHAYSWGFALAAAAATALLAALLESMPQGLDDNLGVPLVASLFLLGLLMTQGHWADLVADGLALRALVGVAIGLAVGGLAYAARTVDRSGLVAGAALAAVIYAFLGWRGFLVLAAFFVIGSGLTKVGYEQKAAARLAQEKGGRRSARHAFANAGVAAACALFAGATANPTLFALAFAGAFATAAADTAGSEIGQAYGRRTVLVTTLRPVPRGTEGAVSLEGTVAGILASMVIGVLGAALGLYPWAGAAVVVAAAFLGTVAESVFGATLERAGLLDNEAINFLNTLVGALVAAALSLLVV